MSQLSINAPRSPETLSVDGPRPLIEWVAGLPRDALSSSERLVLYVLAADAFDDVSRPGVENLARWCGLSRGRAFDLLGALCRPEYERDGTEVRPAYLMRVDGHGSPLAEGVPRGRERVGYRLLAQPSGVPTVRSSDRREVRPSGVPTVQPSGRLNSSTVHSSGRSTVQPPGPSGTPTVGRPSGVPDTPFPAHDADACIAHEDGGLTTAAVVRQVMDAAAVAGRRWEAAGVGKHVQRALDDGHTLQEVLGAGFRAAADPTVKTPAALTWARMYEPEPAIPDTPRYVPSYHGDADDLDAYQRWYATDHGDPAAVAEFHRWYAARHPDAALDEPISFADFQARQQQFDSWWEAYPRKEAQADARQAYTVALTKISADELLSETTAYAASVHGQDPAYIPYPAKWLNGERWRDERAADNSERFTGIEGWMNR